MRWRGDPAMLAKKPEERTIGAEPGATVQEQQRWPVASFPNFQRNPRQIDGRHGFFLPFRQRKSGTDSGEGEARTRRNRNDLSPQHSPQDTRIERAKQ